MNLSDFIDQHTEAGEMFAPTFCDFFLDFNSPGILRTQSRREDVLNQLAALGKLGSDRKTVFFRLKQDGLPTHPVLGAPVAS